MKMCNALLWTWADIIYAREIYKGQIFKCDAEFRVKKMLSFTYLSRETNSALMNNISRVHRIFLGVSLITLEAKLETKNKVDTFCIVLENVIENKNSL